MYTERKCWLCGRTGAADPLDEHHIFGGGLRNKSERYGLTVYLCHHRCHQFGKLSAHQNKETAEKLHKYGQIKAMREQGWTVEEFIMEFGKNYLDDDEIKAVYSDEIPESGSFEVLEEARLPF